MNQLRRKLSKRIVTILYHPQDPHLIIHQLLNSKIYSLNQEISQKEVKRLKLKTKNSPLGQLEEIFRLKRRSQIWRMRCSLGNMCKGTGRGQKTSILKWPCEMTIGYAHLLKMSNSHRTLKSLKSRVLSCLSSFNSSKTQRCQR